MNKFDLMMKCLKEMQLNMELQEVTNEQARDNFVFVDCVNEVFESYDI